METLFQDLLRHEKLRQIEIKCIHLQDELEQRQTLSDGQIEDMVADLRSNLMQRLQLETDVIDMDDRLHNPKAIPRDEVHLLASSKVLSNKKFADAFNIDTQAHVDGTEFSTKELRLEREEKQLEERERKLKKRVEEQDRRESELKQRESAQRKEKDAQRKEHETTDRIRDEIDSRRKEKSMKENDVFKYKSPTRDEKEVSRMNRKQQRDKSNEKNKAPIARRGRSPSTNERESSMHTEPVINRKKSLSPYSKRVAISRGERIIVIPTGKNINEILTRADSPVKITLNDVLKRKEAAKKLETEVTTTHSKPQTNKQTENKGRKRSLTRSKSPRKRTERRRRSSSSTSRSRSSSYSRSRSPRRGSTQKSSNQSSYRRDRSFTKSSRRSRFDI